MEIKQGDKVRVSKDAPRMCLRGWAQVFQIREAEVITIEDDNAVIETFELSLAIPTKYLIKVDAEAKEPKSKYKVGDKVRVLGHALLEGGVYTIIGVEHRERLGWYYQINIHEWYPEIDLEPYTEPTAPTIKVGDRVRNIESGLIGVVDKIVYGNVAWVNGVDGKRYHWKSNDLELVQPKEQTEKKPNVGSIKIPVEVDLSDSYWDAYTADLAHDIAVKIVNKNMGSDPEKVGEYAANVAKSVFEELKRK